MFCLLVEKLTFLTFSSCYCALLISFKCSFWITHLGKQLIINSTYSSLSHFCPNRCKSLKVIISIQASLDRACDQRNCPKERDSLTIEFHLDFGVQRTTGTKKNTDDEKECPRFSEKDGGWALGKRLKDVLTVVACYRQSPTPHSEVLLALCCFISLDSIAMVVRVRVTIF